MVAVTTAFSVVFIVIRQQHLPSSSNNGGKPASKVATAANEQSRYQQVINNNLKSGNTASYELSQLVIAGNFIAQNDFTSASNILSQVQKNVPKAMLTAYYYQLKVQLDQHNKDIASQKTDLQTLIVKLKANQQTSEASYYQQQLGRL